MTRQALGRVLLLLGLAAALGVAWATWQPQRFAALTGGLLPPLTLAVLALLLGLAGAVLARRATDPSSQGATPSAAEVDPEDSVDTIRRRLRESEDKDA